MNEKDWKQTIEKFDLKGKHHLLTLNQLAFFEKHFGFDALPHHQIINSKGQIVRRDIPPIRPENLKFTKELLEKYQINKSLFGIF